MIIMKGIVLGMGLLIAGTIGIVGIFHEMLTSGGSSTMLYVYGLLSLIGLYLGVKGYNQPDL